MTDGPPTSGGALVSAPPDPGSPYEDEEEVRAEDHATEDKHDPFPGQPDAEIPRWAVEARACRATGSALWQASLKVPVRTLRWELRQRAEEWGTVAGELRTVGPNEPGITTEPAGMLVPGMRVPSWEPDDAFWVRLRRVLRNQDGSVSLVVNIIRSGGYAKDEYRNLSHFSSPVLVLA